MERPSGLKPFVGVKAYPVPWRQVAALTPHIWEKSRYSVREFTEQSLPCLQPEPLVLGLESLPESPRFVLVANHYQRKGLWILHPCSVITVALQRHYQLPDPPMHWVVTANWPRIRVGPFSFRSPGDWLLPRVAHALHCYPVSFAGTDPSLTARSYLALLKSAKRTDRPLGLFPEGVAGAAGCPAKPLPGVERLLAHLGKAGLPCVPCQIREILEGEGERLQVRFGAAIGAEELTTASDAAELVMERVHGLA